MNDEKVAKSGDVCEGQIHAVKMDGQTVLTTRVQGKLCAFSGKCPHVGLPLAGGKIVDGTIQCPWHGSRFDLRSGKNLDWVNSLAGMPMPKWSHGMISLGKKPAPLKMYQASERDGAVFVKMID